MHSFSLLNGGPRVHAARLRVDFRGLFIRELGRREGGLFMAGAVCLPERGGLLEGGR